MNIEPVPLERDIPIPKAITAQRGPITLTLEKMQLGQSFCVFPTEGRAAQIHTMAKRLGITIITRTRVERGEWVLRVWRSA